MDKWKTRDGREIAVSDMATSHIESALAMLKRKGAIGPSHLRAYMGDGPSGDLAQYAFQKELDQLLSRPVDSFVDIFEAELQRRREEPVTH